WERKERPREKVRCSFVNCNSVAICGCYWVSQLSISAIHPRAGRGGHLKEREPIPFSRMTRQKALAAQRSGERIAPTCAVRAVRKNIPQTLFSAHHPSHFDS